MEKNKQKGFTLIELSIVLVIVGLIVGGVLVSIDMIRAAKFRQIATDQEKYRTAAMTFKLKYNCLAGDCKNADQFWGTYCQKQGQTNTPCKGNGNKKLSSFTPGDGAGGHAAEVYMFWRHLYLADMIEQEVTGACYGARCGAVNGINIPKTAFDVGMYIINDQKSSNRLLVYNYGTTAQFGWYSWGALYSRYDVNPWSVKETRQYDEKFDDGAPTTGAIVANVNGYWASNCLSGSNYANSDANSTCAITYERWIN